MQNKLNYLDPTIAMRDSCLGVNLNVQDKLPFGCTKILVSVNKGKENLEHIGEFLPHQLYLDDIIKWSENGAHQILITPLFPDVKPIKLFYEKPKEIDVSVCFEEDGDDFHD